MLLKREIEIPLLLTILLLIPLNNLPCYKPSPNVSMGKMDLAGHLTSFVAALRSFSFAYMAIYWLYDDFDYPAFGGGR